MDYYPHLIYDDFYLEQLPFHGDKGFGERAFDEFPLSVCQHGHRRERLVPPVSSRPAVGATFRLSRLVEWGKVEGHDGVRGVKVAVAVEVVVE